jgi:ABC-type amino acid transport substrate-binding protein
MQTTTHWKKLTNPNYLGSWDIDQGESLEIKIVRVQKELVTGIGGDKSECIVATLDGYKPMILNKTNCKTIEKIFGTPYIESWKGKTVKVTTEKVKAFGEVVDALRVVPEKVDDRAELSPESDRWAGAVEALQNGKCDIAYIKKNFRVSADNIKKLQEETNA